MQTVKEYLNACMEYEEVYGFYCIYYLLRERIVLPSTFISQVDWLLVNEIEVQELIKDNPLKIKQTELYAVKGKEKTMVILAENLEQVRGLMLKKFGKLPKIIKMPSSKLDVSFWFEENGTYKTLREIKSTIKEFPHIAFYI